MTPIRPATPADVPVILHFIRSLAFYEREPDAVETTEADLLRDGFGARPRFECLIAEESRGEEDPGKGQEQERQPVGFALYYYNYSTWRGAGIHLEDLFVLPEFRGRGIGRELLARVAQRAVEQGIGWLRWDVLQWNQSAIDFYRSIGARLLSEWRVMRVSGEALEWVAGGAAAGESRS